MTETKQWSKCKIFRPLDQIKENNKNCNICLEQRRRYRQNHKEEITTQSKEYREKNKEELKTKHNEKAECPVCKCMVRSYAMNRHEQSLKHQNNLKNTQKQTKNEEIQKQTKIENIRAPLSHEEIIDNLNDVFPFFSNNRCII